MFYTHCFSIIISDRLRKSIEIHQELKDLFLSLYKMRKILKYWMIINCNFSLFHLAKAKSSKFGNWHKTKTLVFCDHSKFSNVNKIIFIVLWQFY